MAFPTTSVLDTFTDASAPRTLPTYDPTDWADYQAVEGGGLVYSTTVSGTAKRPSSGNTAACYWQTISAVDVEVFIDIVTGTSLQYSVDCRIANPTDFTGSTWNAYQLLYTKASTTLAIVSVVSGSATTLATYTQTVSAGDSIGMSAIGSTITAYYKPSGGAWTTLGSVTDTSITAAGFIGVQNIGTTFEFDNFGGGAPVAPAVLPPLPTIVDFAVARSTSY